MAGRFGEYAEREGLIPASGAAAPQGFTQAYGGRFGEYAQDQAATAPDQVDLTGTFRQWYTGQNLEGTANGWDTDFMRVAQQQYVDSLERGDSLTRFERDDSFGVVTWDGTAKDSKGNALSFGDIVSGGERVGNVYEDVDRHTANVLMGEWTIPDGALKARLNENLDPEKAWNDEMEAIRRANTQQAEVAPRAKEFAENVEEQAEDEEVVGITALGAGGGAAVGAGAGALIGSIVPVAGTALGAGIGAAVGAVVGGVGSWLNQDSLAYQIAREREKLDLIQEQDNKAGYVSQMLSGAAQTVYQVGLSPFANLVQGAKDVGTGFDASSGGAFYETNAEGERTSGWGWQVAEVVSRIGDSALTFASPLGRAVYTAQMSTGIVGRAAGLAPGVGTWDEQALRLDSVWTDDEGNRDWGSAAAGIGNVTVEAVQLGGVRGLFAPLRQTTRRAGEGTWFERLNLSGAQRKALKQGGELEQVAGWKFVIDKQGQVVGKGKTTLSMLAPSESLQALSAKAIARREAARQKGAVDSERLYQAAYELSVGERRVQTMLVNAFGEAQEEGLQTILEPLSHNNSIDPEEVYRAAAAGFASGLGMGWAATATAVSTDDRMYATASLAHEMRTAGDQLSRKDWDGMTQLEKRTMVRSAQLARSVMKGAYEGMERDRTAALQGDVVAAARVKDWWKKFSTAQLESATRATDASHTIVMLDDSRFRSDAIATSHTQLLADQQNRTLGIQTQLDNLLSVDKKTGKETGELARARQKAADNPGDQAAQDRVVELEQTQDKLRRMLDFSRYVEKVVDGFSVQITTAVEQGNTAEVQRLVGQLNAKLASWYDGDNSSIGFSKAVTSTSERLLLARAVSRIATRHPEDSTASFQSFLPQVDEFFAVNRVDGIAAVSQLTNKGMRSDFDGDKVHTLQQLVLDDKEYVDLRSGANILGASITPEIKTTDAEKFLYNEIRVALADPNGTVRGMAHRFGNEIADSLRDMYVTPGLIDQAIIDAVMVDVRDAIASGGDVANVLLTEMVRQAGTDLMAIGRGEKARTAALVTNEYFELARMVSEHTQTFQQRYAGHRPLPQGASMKQVSPSRASTTVKERRGILGATEAATMLEVVPGNNLFRMFQKLHYNLMSSTQKWVGWSSEAKVEGFQRLAEFYEQLSRDAEGLTYDEIPANDDIVRAVLTKLRLLAKDPATLQSLGVRATPATNMALLANVATARWVWDTNPSTGLNERRYTGETVTLAQQLLYESAEQYKAARSQTWESDESAQSTYNKLIALSKPPKQKAKRQANAERAFVEVFDAVPLFELVGEASISLGITSTLGQFYRDQLDKSPEERAAEHAVLRSYPEYRNKIDGETNKVGNPYGLEQVEGLQVTAYRTLVDSVFSSASAAISRTQSGATKGEITGHFKDTDDTIETEIQKTWEAVRNRMRQWKAKQTYTSDDVRAFTEADPEAGRLILAGIPDHLMPIVYKGSTQDGRPMLAEWYYQVFAEPNGKAAAWKLRWNTWIDGWQAEQSRIELDEGDPFSYERMGSRFHRLLAQLSTLDVASSHYLQELLVKGQTADSTETFMKWLNNESGLVTQGAPMLAWVDDTADFDSTKTGSGWTQTKSTTQLREDWKAMRDGINRRYNEVNEAELRRAEDKEYIRSIRRGMRAEKGITRPGEVVSQDDEQHWKQFKAAVDSAKDSDIAYGPRAMVLQTAINVFGIYGQAHTKGSNPEHLAAVEAAEALLGAFGYTVNLERLVGDVTAHDERAVASAPELIVKDSGRMMDGDGNQVQWGPQTAENLLDLLESDKGDVDTIHLVTTMLAPQVIELGFDNNPRRQALHGLGVKALLDSTSKKSRYPDEGGAPGLANALKYLAELESQMRTTDPFAVQRRVQELVTRRTNGLDHTAGIVEIQAMTARAYVDVARALQEASRIKEPAPGDVDGLNEVWEKVRDDLRLRSAKRIYGVDISTQTELGKEKTAELVKLQVLDRYKRQQDALKAEIRKTRDATRQQQLIDYSDALARRQQAELDRAEQLIDHDVVGMTVDTYLYDAKMTEEQKQFQRDRLMEFVAQNTDVLPAAGDAADHMQKILRYFYEKSTVQNATQPNLTDKQWTELSQMAISLHISKLVSVGAAENMPPAYPTETQTGKLDKSRYWDYTGAYLADFVKPGSTDGLMEAARKHAVSAGITATDRTPTEVAQVLMDTIYREDMGPWTPTIPIQGIEQYELTTGASSSVAISMAGLLTQRHSATASATRRTFEMPPASLDSRAWLSWDDLEFDSDRNGINNPYERMVEITLPGGRKITRPMIQLNKRFARVASVTYTDPTTGQRDTLDLMTDNATSPWGPSFDDDSDVSQELRVVSLDRIRDRVERLADEISGGNRSAKDRVLRSIDVSLDFLHPEAQPEAKEYYNNLWFEGTVFDSSADVSDSLLYSLWFGAGGINAQVQQAALDTRKLGLAGIEHYTKPDRKQVADLEDKAEDDFAAMIAGKTRLVMETDLGNGVLDPNFYNAVFKLMKLKHWVDGTDQDGNRVRLTAEQVIARQNQFGPGYWDADGNALRDTSLWIPSDQVLAEVMGEQGYGGPEGRFRPRPLSTNTDDIPTFQGWPANSRIKVEKQLPRALTDTMVAHTLRLAEPKGGFDLDAKQRDKFRRQEETFRFHRARVRDERQKLMQHGFDPKATLATFLDRTHEWLGTRDITVQLERGLEWARVPAAESLAASRAAILAYIDTQSQKTGYSLAGWVYEDDGDSNPYAGLLSSLADAQGSLPLGPGDPVTVNFASFYKRGSHAEARAQAEKVIEFLVSQNVTIIPASSNGPSNLATEMAAVLRGKYGYERYMDDSRILVPGVMHGRRYQNAAASQSSLSTSSGVTVRNQRIMGLLKNRRVEENTLIIPQGRRSRFESVQARRGLLPTNVAANFGVPMTAEHLAMVRNHLDGLNTPEGIEHLRNRLKSPGKDDFAEAWKRLMLRIDASLQENTTLPIPGQEFGTGDIIPLLSADGELLLYRHGYQFPYEDFHSQLRTPLAGKSSASNVAVYSGKPVKGASTVRGTVTKAFNRQKYGLQIELEIDSKALGSKQVVEVNGMKWLLAPLGGQFTEPQAPVLGRGTQARWFDGFGSWWDAKSKQATNNVVLNTRNAFTFFGFDALPKLTRALGLTSESAALDILRAVERAPGKRSERATKELQDLIAGGSAQVQAIQSLVPTLDATSPTVNWENVLEGDTLDSFTLRAMLLYLTTEGASLDAALYSSGLWIEETVEPGAQSQRMPRLFTRMFDLTPVGSTVRTELFDEFNSKLGSNVNEEWVLGQDWTLYGRAADGSQVEMILDFGEAHVSDDNPELNVQAQDRKLKQGSSMHASLVTEFGVGGDTFVDSDVLKTVDKALFENNQTRLERGELWRMFSKPPKETFGPGTQWQRDTPAELEYHGLSMVRFLQYRTPIDWKQESLIQGDDIARLEAKRQAVITALGWDSDMVHMVDYWIRQHLWKPGAAPGQTNYDDVFNTDQILGVLDKMLSNIEDGRFPTYGAAGPSQISETDLRVMRSMALRSTRAFRPWRKAGDPTSAVDPKDYGAWIAASFGQAWNTDVEIDEVARLDYDGFMNSYRSILKQRGRFMDITMDKELQGKLLDEQTNELIAYSTSPVDRKLLMETVILPQLNLGLDGLRHGVNMAENLVGFEAETSWLSHSRRRVVDFRRKNKIRPKERTSARDYVQYGAKVLDSNADMHSLSRIMLALRHGTTMLNPGLYISMIPEQAFRLYLRGVADVLSGESSGGVVGAAFARAGASQFTPELITRLNRLHKNLAADNTFAGGIIKDLMYQPAANDTGGGRIVRAFEKFASLGNKWQDPTWGTPQRALARTYVDSVIRAVQSRPISNVMTIEQIIDALEKDHSYFARKHPEIHQIASNNVIDNRGLKNTIYSVALKSVYEPLTRSSSPTIQFAGTLLKLPLMYANFSMNMLTTLTGTQGWSQALATFVDGRQTAGTLMNRIAKKLRGEELTDADDIRYDLSSTMDGYTIANAFIRGGVTQTSLFTLGMLAGGVLGGEDDEAKRRRKLAQAQNVPMLADPRRLEADFRNKDLFFLDWLPSWLEPLQSFATVTVDPETGETRSAMKMSWLMKPFLSPILGMEKFFQTGDFDWIRHGFYDAVGSLPVFNKNLWDDAVRSADELTALAQEQQEVGTVESTRNTMFLLVSAVGVYERMLFENMFINSIYTGFDKYDRDATALPLRDSDGDIQRTLEGEPRPNDLALETFLDEDGNVVSGYQNRDDFSQLMAYYTKNNFSAMAALSLFTGFRQDLNRYDMPVKMREIELPQISQDEAVDVIGTILQAEYAKNGGPKVLSLQEITKTLGSYYASNGMWDEYNNVDAEAASIYEDQKQNPSWNPLSVLDKNGQEVLTTEGAARVMQSLTNGMVDLDSPSLQGISIPFEMREQIQRDFLEDVMQQGVDMGMTNSQALQRAKRLFYGPIEDPTVIGFSDVLWSNKIAYEPNRYYKQLNTTYVRGPDGYPWATGFKRGGVLNQMGLPQRANLSTSGAVTTDSRMNTVDLVAGINTGLRGLEPFHATENVPTDVEIGKAIEDAIRDIELKADGFEPFDNKKSNGRFYGGYRRYGRRSGGGGFGSSTPRIYFSRQPYLSDGTNVYGDSAKNIFWDNPTIRRARIRRERYTSQRGRLNQWQ